MPQTYYIKDHKACNGAKELRLEQLILCSQGKIIIGLKDFSLMSLFQIIARYKVTSCSWAYYLSRRFSMAWHNIMAFERNSLKRIVVFVYT